LKKKFWLIAIVFTVLVLDQWLKIWVKTNMEYGDEFKILGIDWALIHFVENNGMAFGLSLGGEYGKLVLSVFRIIAVGFLIYYLNFLLNSGAKKGILISFSLILAGAIGNIIDSAFYGLIFSESTYHGGLAEIFPEAGGYATFLHGKVVDMFYFPIINGFLPEWFPIWGGKHIMFFQPVFNVADASITLGVINMLLFNRTFFANQKVEEKEEEKKESY
jgi:signal peptidase II